MNYQFAYLVGALIFDTAWLGCYLVGKKYRPQMIWGTVISAPVVATLALTFLLPFLAKHNLFHFSPFLHSFN